jgi:poly(3-hydroxybutyrate) depolymerase
VVVAGLSAGAGLAALRALRHPQRVAGVVMHSGVPPGKARSTADALRAMRGCAAPAPLDVPTGVALPPLLVIHGSLDGIVAPSNGHAAVQVWAAACGASARPTRRIQRGRRHALLWTDHACGRRVVASLAIVQGGGHAWSGGAAGLKFSDPKGPDASRLVWAFARRVFGLVGSRGAGFGSAGFGSAQPATTVG